MIQTAYVSVPTVKRTNGNFVTLSVTGNGTIAGTLGVTGAVTVGSLETVGDLTVGGSTVDLGTATVGGAGDFSWATGEFSVSSPVITLDSPIGQLSGTWSALTTSTFKLLGTIQIGNNSASACDLRAKVTTSNGGHIVNSNTITVSGDGPTTINSHVRRVVTKAAALTADTDYTLDLTGSYGETIDFFNMAGFNINLKLPGGATLGQYGPGAGSHCSVMWDGAGWVFLR